MSRPRWAEDLFQRGLKKCTRCKEIKQFSEFHTSRSRSGGLQGYCKSCAKSSNYQWREQNPGRLSEIKRDSHARTKQLILDHYGAFCSCCGEANPKFLTIDHINDDGAEHRREIGRGSRNFYAWLVKNSFPTGFRTLCFNCNAGRHWNGGICPHEEEVMLHVAASA